MVARGADDGRLCRPKPGFHTEETGRRARRQRPERSREPGARPRAGRRGRREPRGLASSRHLPTGRSGPPCIHPRPCSGRAVAAQKRPLPRTGPGATQEQGEGRRGRGSRCDRRAWGLRPRRPPRRPASSLAKRSAAIVAVRMMRSSVCRYRTILSRLSCGVPPPGKQSGAGAEGPTRPVSRHPPPPGTRRSSQAG